MAAADVATSTPPRAHLGGQTTPFEIHSSLEEASPPASERLSSATSSYEDAHERGVQRSPKHYAFSPPTVKSLPRAWERRAATPYVARNDAQRIWKRTPLGGLPANGHEGWRKGNHAASARPVKKLRVGQSGPEDNKENCEYIASKWEEDEAAPCSPKRKVVASCPVFTGRGIDMAEENDCLSEESSEGTGRSDYGGDEQKLLHESNSATCDALQDEPEAGSDHRTPDIDSVGSVDVSDNVPPANEDEVIPGIQTLISDQIETSSLPASAAALSAMILSPSLSISNSPKSTGEEKSEARLSPPSKIVEVGPGAADPVPLTTDHEDTAYLHDFLFRARAQKAAKQHSVPAALPESIGIEDTIGEDLPAAFHVEDMDRAATTTAAASQEEAANLRSDQENDVNISPCRRSSRLVTRVPRPQKLVASLPNNISLKRLNGTEFIAAQRETPSLALTTRNNTKNNKADAVSVKVKLMQLNAEEKARMLERNTLTQPQATKKRKKRCKEVTWDSTIARCQDGTSVPLPAEAEEEAEADPAPTVDDDTPDKAEDKSEDEDKSKDHISEPQEPTLEVEDKKPGKKVRKLRKLNAGTVNGTPAPKRTLSIPVPVGYSVSSDKVAAAMPKLRGGGALGDFGAGSNVAGSEKRMQTRTRTRTRMP